MQKCALIFLISSVIVSGNYAQQIKPEDLVYQGAFRLPEGSGGSDWDYSGQAATYYPDGDPGGPNDTYPGSLFAIGHDHQQFVSELSIPVPIISANKNPEELNTATTLQPFHDITGGRFGYLELPVAGLAFLAPQGWQSTAKLYFCWGQHIQYQEVSHGWCELNLDNPQTAGPWHFGNYNNFTSNDYLFEIPAEWANAHVAGKHLASGRFREGVWSGLGPALYAYAPWEDGNPLPVGDTLKSITRLLLYGVDDPNIPEIITDETRKMVLHNYADQWTGACWLTAGDNSAVVFIGTKGLGNCWYGFGDGTVWPYEGPYPPIPDPPHDQRGFWADSIRAQILFYDPSDLADVVNGSKQTWEPQPYAVLDIDDFLFDPGYDYWQQKNILLGASCFDRERGLLYVFERLADEEKSLVHVWKVKAGSTGIEKQSQQIKFELFQNFPNPFNAATIIRFEIPKSAFVSVAVFDFLGRTIKILGNNQMSAGLHEIDFEAGDLASGMYFYRIKTGDFEAMKKFVILK